jgi:Dynamin family/Dynamin central region
MNISQIKVPRGSGTCTRCPVEINLSEDPSLDAEWRCDVSLSQKYTFAPSVQNRATRNKPLGPWVDKELETFPFASLRTKDDVGTALEWAQLATLNPSSDYNVYKSGSNHGTAKTLQVPFSPNVVRLDITGPGLLNLSFYDLPGVVSQDQHSYVPQLVENLVKEYIRAENCIVLHTLTMNHDAANSIAARIIHESKAQDRTIGVLTKPDLFAGESIEQWRDILDGRMFPRKLGYYVVKNNAKESVDHATARTEEKTFFENMTPFSTHLKYHSKRFGTWHLQKALSMMLATQIKASLPKLIMEIGSKLEKTKDKIGHMPKPPEGNVAGAVESQIFELTRKIGNEIDGGSLECETFFFTKWHEQAKKFGDHLICSRPLIVRPKELTLPPLPKERGDDSPTSARSNGPIEPMIISDDDGDDPVPKRSKLVNTPQSGQKRQNRGDVVPPTPQKANLTTRIRRRDGFKEAQSK